MCVSQWQYTSIFCMVSCKMSQTVYVSTHNMCVNSLVACKCDRIDKTSDIEKRM